MQKEEKSSKKIIKNSKNQQKNSKIQKKKQQKTTKNNKKQQKTEKANKNQKKTIKTNIISISYTRLLVTKKSVAFMTTLLPDWCFCKLLIGLS